MNKNQKIEVVLVSVDKYLDAARDSIELGKNGVTRIVLLHGQEAIAEVLRQSDSLEGALSALVKQRDMPHQ